MDINKEMNIILDNIKDDSTKLNITSQILKIKNQYTKEMEEHNKLKEDFEKSQKDIQMLQKQNLEYYSQIPADNDRLKEIVEKPEKEEKEKDSFENYHKLMNELK